MDRDQQDAEDFYECPECGDGDALIEGEECAYCGWIGESDMT